jgi:hypothetical protein
MDTGRYHVVCGKIATVAADRNGIAFFGGARYNLDDNVVYIHIITTLVHLNHSTHQKCINNGNKYNNTNNAGILLSGRTD